MKELSTRNEEGKASELSPALSVEPAELDKIRNSLPKDLELERLSSFFSLFGDKNRLRLIQTLLYAELCVGDLSLILGMSQSAVSHQLKLLRLMEVVTFRKQGKVVFYRLKDEHVSHILSMGLEHIREV